MSTQINSSYTDTVSNQNIDYNIALMNAVRNAEADFDKSRMLQHSEGSMNDIKHNHTPIMDDIKLKTSITSKKLKNKIKNSKTKMKKLVTNKYIEAKGLFSTLKKRLEIPC